MMIPLVDFAPGAEENGLACKLVDRIRQNIGAHPSKLRDFDTLRGSIAVIAKDAGESLTLRFDHGRLTVHDGVVGIPDVTFSGESAAPLALLHKPPSRSARLLSRAHPNIQALEVLLRMRKALVQGHLTVYGWWLHVPFLFRFLRLLSMDLRGTKPWQNAGPVHLVPGRSTLLGSKR